MHVYLSCSRLRTERQAATAEALATRRAAPGTSGPQRPGSGEEGATTRMSRSTAACEKRSKCTTTRHACLYRARLAAIASTQRPVFPGQITLSLAPRSRRLWPSSPATRVPAPQGLAPPAQAGSIGWQAFHGALRRACAAGDRRPGCSARGQPSRWPTQPRCLVLPHRRLRRPIYELWRPKNVMGLECSSCLIM